LYSVLNVLVGMDKVYSCHYSLIFVWLNTVIECRPWG